MDVLKENEGGFLAEMVRVANGGWAGEGPQEQATEVDECGR